LYPTRASLRCRSTYRQTALQTRAQHNRSITTRSQHHSITAAQQHSTSRAPQHHNTISASQHHSITASQHHSITASQHRTRPQHQSMSTRGGAIIKQRFVNGNGPLSLCRNRHRVSICSFDSNGNSTSKQSRRRAAGQREVGRLKQRLHSFLHTMCSKLESLSWVTLWSSKFHNEA
jgi:hypothetical protein